LIPFSELVVQHIPAPLGRRFHLSLHTTEMAEASFGQSGQLDNIAAILEYEVLCRIFVQHSTATTSELTKIARVLVRFDHVDSRILDADHSIM
jgi:hypothetical protein